MATTAGYVHIDKGQMPVAQKVWQEVNKGLNLGKYLPWGSGWEKGENYCPISIWAGAGI